ncbi:toll/interleukin-1 receptor domain-containing protein [Neptunicella marina]|uniref:Toll/interleukin-1 receptor domain-containing protein n=1 Tax=Neptunicella marina TaxID=2125989 RepID=A0A8J6IRV1_9ALTE|nr:toll/interleukin-1 receptor domain-containing protein [Neptunicella marina]MBC3764625.1 toll/interleukin-1 receptor domain-containing protein [Neptunicella marina]
MNGLEKIEFLDNIGSELQSRMTFSDIDTYFRGYGVPTQDDYPHNSKRAYAKDMLANVDDELLFKIADELGIIEVPNSSTSAKDVSFWKAGHFRLFLSHLASFKVQTSHLQTALRKYAISSFVAHEDIEPTKEWQNEIEAGLRTMDAIAAILMPGFQESKWCDQEVGVAVGRDVLVIPIRKGQDPYGFIGKYQGIQAKGKTIGEVAEAVFKTLVKSPKTRNKILVALSGAIANATTSEEAIEKVLIFNSLDGVPSEILENLKQQVVDNSRLTESKEFVDNLNMMLSKFNVKKLTIGKTEQEAEWDDIPF